MQLIRTFHAIGQGAFYTERFYENSKNVFNAIYDCGTSNSQKKLIEEIHKEFAEGTRIDYLFVSHFHNDHTSGIMELEKYLNIANYIIPVISPQMLAESAIHDYLWVKRNDYKEKRFDALFAVLRIVSSRENTLPIGEERRILPVNNSWVYIPFNPLHIPSIDILDELDNNNCHQLAEAFRNRQFDEITEEIKRVDLNILKSSYSNVFGNHHYYVMPVYSGYEDPLINNDERICLYTGDYDASDFTKVNALTNPLRSKWNAVGTLQVPHHGSKNNNCQDLYFNEDRFYVISSFGSSNYNHPHGETIGYICNNRKANLQLVNTTSCLPTYTQNFSI